MIYEKRERTDERKMNSEKLTFFSHNFRITFALSKNCENPDYFIEIPTVE
jgi:hypothetical protein